MITAQLVKELRDRTGISMMDCKSALVEADGDIDKAIEVLRKKSVIKAEKKSSRATNEGVIVIGQSSDGNFIIEVNTETDFAAKDADFQVFLSDLSAFCSDNNPKDLNELEESYKDQLLEIIQKIGENIKISHFEKVSNEEGFVYSYLHTDKKLAALVKLDKDQPELGRDIAMQVSANSPLAISTEDIDQDI
ncbi:MAG: translation elongation factor Ts, partial [Gammaproteobacteria bacterium]|nr:translation elongation factor Ts [Gammaproteobacteria bacterium]